MESGVRRLETYTSPEVVGPPPRTAQITGRGIALTAVATIVICASVAYASMIGAEAARQFQLRRILSGGGRETTGRITKLRNPYPLKEYVEYTFDVGGRSYAGEAIVPLQFYQSLQSASSLTVRYRPQYPSANEPVDWTWSLLSEWEDPYLVLSLVAGLGCALFIPLQIFLERKLVTKGLAAVGAVKKCSVSGRGGEFITLTYDFRTEGGALVHGRGSSQTRKEVGANILILYVPNKPNQNIPYPSANWRVAK